MRESPNLPGAVHLKVEVGHLLRNHNVSPVELEYVYGAQVTGGGASGRSGDESQAASDTTSPRPLCASDEQDRALTDLLNSAPWASDSDEPEVRG